MTPCLDSLHNQIKSMYQSDQRLLPIRIKPIYKVFFSFCLLVS